MTPQWKGWVERAKRLEGASGACEVAPMPDGLPEWEDAQGDTTVGFVDTETTGTSPDEDEVVELGLVVASVETATGKIARAEPARTWLRRPAIALSAHVRAINGIEEADLERPTWDAGEIEAALGGCEWLIAHNAGFDRDFVERFAPAGARARWACTLRDADWGRRGMAKRSLEWLCANAGLWYGAHRAGEDARACAALTQIARGSGDEGRLLGEIIEHAGRPSTMIGVEARVWPGDAVNAALRREGLRHDPRQRTWWTDARTPAEARSVIACATRHWPQAMIVRAAGTPHTRYHAHPKWTSRESVAQARRRMEGSGPGHAHAA